MLQEAGEVRRALMSYGGRYKTKVTPPRVTSKDYNRVVSHFARDIFWSVFFAAFFTVTTLAIGASEFILRERGSNVKIEALRLPDFWAICLITSLAIAFLARSLALKRGFDDLTQLEETEEYEVNQPARVVTLNKTTGSEQVVLTRDDVILQDHRGRPYTFRASRLNALERRKLTRDEQSMTSNDYNLMCRVLAHNKLIESHGRGWRWTDKGERWQEEVGYPPPPRPPIVSTCRILKEPTTTTTRKEV